MRVIGGSARGVPLQSVPGDTTRPILDRIKQSLFDMLRPRIQEMNFLDLFGGSGSVGIEALSQGASTCIFVDVEKKAVETIKKNLEKTKLAEKAKVRFQDAFTYLRNTKNTFDFIFVAPPQYKGVWIRILQELSERPGILNSAGEIIVQIDPKEDEEIQLSNFIRADERTHGNTKIIFYKHK